MGLLGFLLGRRPPRETAEQRARREQSERQVADGGIPVAAQERLGELRPGFFTSDLSVKGFSLLAREGIEPLTQVMGSSVFRHPGRANVLAGVRQGGRWTPHAIRNVDALDQAYNGARARALARLRQEAELAGADAVVGVRMGGRDNAWSDGNMNEFVAFGTAVRLPSQLRTGRPVITDLTVQDYWKLAQAGYHPRGVVAISTVVYVVTSRDHNRIMSPSWFNTAGYRNQELGEFTQGYRAARTRAMEQVEAQARALAADGIVGVTIEQHLEENEWEDGSDNKHVDLLVTLHLLGTAITQGHPPLKPPAPLTVIPLRKGAPVA